MCYSETTAQSSTRTMACKCIWKIQVSSLHLQRRFCQNPNLQSINIIWRLFLCVGHKARDEWIACFVTKGNGQINISNASDSVSTSLLAVKDLQTANPAEAFAALPLPAVTERKVGSRWLNHCFHAGRCGEKSDGTTWPRLSAHHCFILCSCHA